jgi:hypothetical protein
MPSCYTGAAFRSLAAQAPRTIRLSRRRTSSARPMRVEVHCAEPSTAFQRMPRAGSGKLLIWSCSQTYLLPRPAVLDGKRAGQGMSRSAPWRYLRLVLVCLGVGDSVVLSLASGSLSDPLAGSAPGVSLSASAGLRMASSGPMATPRTRTAMTMTTRISTGSFFSTLVQPLGMVCCANVSTRSCR